MRRGPRATERLEPPPASNPCLAFYPERQALDSERSAEHIWLHARRATFLPPPCSRESPREVSRPMPAARPPRTAARLESLPRTPARAAGVGQRTQRGAYLAARTPCDLPPTTLQPRVSARSESSDACHSPASNARPPRTTVHLEQPPASNKNHTTIFSKRKDPPK